MLPRVLCRSCGIHCQPRAGGLTWPALCREYKSAFVERVDAVGVLAMSAIRSSDAVDSERPPDGSSGLRGTGTSSPSGAATEQLDVPEPRGGGGMPRPRFLAAWPLLAVLLVQAGLSLRLVRADTAYQSEAAALWSGHLQWAHWLHGEAIPPFPAFFSGAPVMYPPLGAAADSIGGLTGARVLSLVFMLAATALLWAAAGGCSGGGPRSSPPRCSPR